MINAHPVRTESGHFDLDGVLSRLKPFQLATVNHAFRRLWIDDEPVNRFLVADEVGLGKTLIAKGVAARAIDHLRRTREGAVTIVYICSNNQIAGQNLERLRELTGERRSRTPTASPCSRRRWDGERPTASTSSPSPPAHP